MNILVLPAELLITILAHLGARDILAFCRVCHFARLLYEGCTLLQYLVELDASGMDEVDCPFDLDLADRLMYIRNREKLWGLEGLGHHRRISIPVEHAHSHLHALSAGVYVLGDLGPQPDTLRTNSLHYVRLPKCHHLIGQSKEPRAWWAPRLLGIEALCIGLSLEEQDLLAVLTAEQVTNQSNRDILVFRLHLKSFAKETYHPRAHVPIITIHEHSNEGNHCIASIQIAGPYLLLLLTWLRLPNTSDELYVYDWREGQLIDHKSTAGFTYRGTSFLSDNTFFLTNIRQNTLEFLQIIRTSGRERRFLVKEVGKLGLPPLQAGSSIVSMTCWTDVIRTTRSRLSSACSGIRSPSMTRASSTSSSNGPGPYRSIVRCEPDMALVQFRMYVQSARLPVPEHVSHFSFVAHRGELLRIARMSHGGDTLDEYTGRVTISSQALPWNAWGPHLTRWSGIDEADTAWMAGVSGQRQAIVSSSGFGKIRIRNYNVNTIRKCSVGAINNAHSRVVTTNSLTAHQGCFMNDIQSSLPYVEVVSPEEYDYDAVQIDEDRIVAVRENEDDGLLHQLDVFVMVPDRPKTCDCNEITF